MAPISRHEFLQRTAMAGAACLLSSIEGFAVAQQKKIRVGVIGCGSVSTQYLPHLRSRRTSSSSAPATSSTSARSGARQSSTSPSTIPHIDKMLAGAPFDLLVT